MVKKVSKKASKKLEQEPQEATENAEKELTSVAASQSDESDESAADSDDDDIEGLSSGDEDENGSTHKIKKLDLKKKNQKSSSNKDSSSTEYSAIIYVSRLPHGFHEKELSKYFSQFGDLKEVRLARNKKSGNSRHYGFVEFANKDDARVAQETMNNYLIMGHLLQVRLLPKGSKIEKLYKYRKRAFQHTAVKKSADQLKEKAKAKHDERMRQLDKAGIQFTW
ncbi:hypothetical protein HG536_0D03300 [Torulaspora globosa]|uniref:RRM domain-containing protein n=1 Tax=Torulaspora globosa TaxID=48254 RepID=A0A7G3ZH22_9SACH|nr:uncharacterized protein HG536_0D03300 [Torulaspora globosa]QLL32808.1 hypothetical protein HG536_0D03300 [Torulaspora globosa]